MSSAALVEHFFRHEYGRLVAILCRKVGVQHVEAVEDAVQTAMLAALESWPVAGLPTNPSAWLFRAAHNSVVGQLRQHTRRRSALERHATEDCADVPDGEQDVLLAHDVRDDVLRMLFLCCDEAIPVESQLVFALKTLCGFDVREIALRLFSNEAGVYKRLSRARSRLRTLPLRSQELTEPQIVSRLPAVRQILYLMFTEGYLSSDAATAIRRELCAEAVRLATIVAEHPLGHDPETCALLALMHFHLARMAARQDDSGALLLLQEQDRNLWDTQEIGVGLRWLAESARGDVFSRFHAEAGIAAEHCLARSFDETRWPRVVAHYALLEQRAPSALHALNRAIAVAEWRGPAEGLVILAALEPPAWLAESHMWTATLADLHRRCGNAEMADHYQLLARDGAPTPAIRELLERRHRTVSVG